MRDACLTGKKILFFSPAFFSYEQKIKSKMEKMGAIVRLYDERVVSSPLSRALLKIVPALFYHKANEYFKKIIGDNIHENFDYILIVRCDMVTQKTISLLRKSFPNAKLCLHLWDSIKNVRGIKKKIELFDFATSFDLADCENNKFLHFRPLFFTEDFGKSEGEIKYDLCFCGTIHSDRFFIIDKLFKQADENGFSTFKFAYLQAPFVYYYYKLFAKGFKKAKKTFFSFQRMSIEEISKIEDESRVVLDIQHPRQTGLTMRTIEMVGAQKMFITTNSEVAKYDFYNPNNILIIDRHNPVLDLSFFRKSYERIPNKIYEKYSLKQWLIDVLGVKE